MAENKWVKIGVVGVDSGYLLITDYPEQGEVKNAYDLLLSHDPIPQYLQLNFDLGHEGAGIIFATGLGDGIYPVYAKIEEVMDSETGVSLGERIKEVRIKFVPHPVLGTTFAPLMGN